MNFGNISIDAIYRAIEVIVTFILGGFGTWLYNKRKQKLELSGMSQDNESKTYSGYKTAVNDLNKSYINLHKDWTDARDSLIVLDKQITTYKKEYDKLSFEKDKLACELSQANKKIKELEEQLNVLNQREDS